MNKISFTHEKVNDGKQTSFYVPITKKDEKVLMDQITEIFIEQHYKKGRIKKDMTIIDCGANIGLASLYFKDYAKKIYALEPNPKNFECLVENTKDIPHIQPFNIGLSARTAIEHLRNNGDYPISESLFGTGEIKEEVKLQSINEFFEEQKIEHVDLLKMDTEGAEYIIFPSFGFSKIAHRIDYIIGEAHYVHQLIPDYIPLILKDCGFETQFLPIKNMFVTMAFDDVIKRKYSVEKQTIFLAKRKDLPWPN